MKSSYIKYVLLLTLLAQPLVYSTDLAAANVRANRSGLFNRCIDILFGRPKTVASVSTAAVEIDKVANKWPTAPTLSHLDRYSALSVTPTEFESIRPVLIEYAIKNQSNYFDIVNEIYNRLSTQPYKSQLELAETLARFAQHLIGNLPETTDLSKKEFIQYHLGVAIMNLELMPISEWHKNTESILARNKSENISIGPLQFAEWTHAYIKKTSLYNDATHSTNSVLSALEIRDLFAHNHWPITAKNHDSRHIHFAVGNPLGPALVLKSSRTINLKRHVLISMLFEGIERFQFASEFALTKLMHGRGFNLTSGLLYVATATEAQLDELIASSNLIANEIDKRANVYQNFRPSLYDKWSREFIATFGLEQELDQMVKAHLLLLDDENYRWLTNYTKNPDENGAQENDLTIHH